MYIGNYNVNGENVSKATFETIIDQGLMIDKLKARVTELEDRIEDLTELSDNQNKLKVHYMELHSIACAERDQLLARVAELEEEEEFQAAANARLREDLAKTQGEIDAAFAEGRFAEINTRNERIKELEEFANEREAARIRAQIQWVDMKNERDNLQSRVAELQESALCENRFTQKFGNELQVVTKERDQLRAELRVQEQFVRIHKKVEEQLRAELEALKPKPVVKVKYIQIGTEQLQYRADETFAQLAVTFSDGVLVDAEVIGEKK